jgi:SH3 domain-containing protein
MTLTADQYFQISQGYAKAAVDPYVSREGREAFAHKAEWLDFLGRRQAGTLRTAGTVGMGDSSLAARLLAGEVSYAEQPRRARRPLVTTLCLTGAALFLTGTLLFSNALNLFGYSERQDVTSSSVEANATGQDERQFRPPAERAHPISLPISPGQLSYLTPVLTGLPIPLPKELSSPSPPPEQVKELAPVEVLKVRANATIRNGPSTKAKKIGAATPGTALQVKAREGNWVQFVNSSGAGGWIHSSLVELTPESGTTSSAITRADAPALMTPKPKVAKKRIKQSPKASIQESKNRQFFFRRGGMALGPSGVDLSSR